MSIYIKNMLVKLIVLFSVVCVRFFLWVYGFFSFFYFRVIVVFLELRIVDNLVVFILGENNGINVLNGIYFSVIK